MSKPKMIDKFREVIPALNDLSNAGMFDKPRCAEILALKTTALLQEMAERIDALEAQGGAA